MNISRNIIMVFTILMGLATCYSCSGNGKNSPEYVGEYLVDSDSTLLHIKENGTFNSNTELLPVKSGKWKIIDFDEFYNLELRTSDGKQLKVLEISRKFGKLTLRTNMSFTNIEDRLELTKIDTHNTH